MQPPWNVWVTVSLLAASRTFGTYGSVEHRADVERLAQHVELEHGVGYPLDSGQVDVGSDAQRVVLQRHDGRDLRRDGVGRGQLLHGLLDRRPVGVGDLLTLLQGGEERLK